MHDFASQIQQDTDAVDLTGRKKKAPHPFADLDVALGRYLDANTDMAPCADAGT